MATKIVKKIPKRLNDNVHVDESRSCKSKFSTAFHYLICISFNSIFPSKLI